MGVISGKGGAVDGSAEVRGWSINSEADLQAYVDSATKGGTARTAGNEDWSGQYQAYGHTPVRMPGTTFQFKGSIDGAVGVDSGAGGSIVDQVEIRIDIESGAIIEHTVQFSANAALAFGAAVAADASVPDPPTSIGCKIQTAEAVAAPSFADILDVRTITLTITSDNKMYVSSESAGQVKRVAGNIDFTVQFDVYVDDFSDAPAVNEVANLRLFVNATEFWDLKWVRYGESSDNDVQIEGADVVGATLNASMHGFANVDGDTPTEGFIKDPSGATFWP
jgi:hypothetical protein